MEQIQQQDNTYNTVKILICGAIELKKERNHIIASCLQIDKDFYHDNIRISVHSYENLSDSREQINYFIENEADIIIFVLDDKMGYETELEFTLAAKTFLVQKRPEIMVYLRRNHNDITPEIARLQRLLMNEANMYYTEYSTLIELEHLVEVGIRKHILKLKEENRFNSAKTQKEEKKNNGIFRYKQKDKINNKIIEEPTPIFISYKREDSDIVFHIREKIEQKTGIKCWIDLEGIESDAQFSNVIIKAINQAKVFLFMYSHSYAKIEDYGNDWTVKEINFAQKKDKIIVFINLDDSPLTDWFLLEFGLKQQVKANSSKAMERLYRDIVSWLK